MMRAYAVLCGFIAGLIVVLLAIGSLLAWYFLPIYFDLNATWLLIGAAGLTPLLASAVGASVNNGRPLYCGFILATLCFVIQALPLYGFMPELWQLKSFLAWYIGSVLIGMIGACCGLNIATIRRNRRQKKGLSADGAK